MFLVIVIVFVIVILGIYLLKQKELKTYQDHEHKKHDETNKNQSPINELDITSPKGASNQALHKTAYRQNQTTKHILKPNYESKPKYDSKAQISSTPQTMIKQPLQKIYPGLRKMATIWRKPADAETCYRCNGALTAEKINLASFKYGKIQGYVHTSAWACPVCKYVCANESAIVEIKKQVPGHQFQINEWGVIPKIITPVNETKKHEFKWPSTYAVETLKPGSQKVGSQFSQESPLHKLGYKITDSNRTKRWTILENEALPKLGLEKVANVIATNVKARKRQKGGAKKYSHAIYEWEYDLKKLKDTYYRRDFQWPSTD
ncbi:hypothetical protein [Paenibacillus planticolens]|uniref:Uncharacterized protein n=1 Tax=Paenibacillus planticolens TaxID=2654976 RepID=A0ABX1ZHF9_9BACL|nr:hypothetical protein [Paenibacillus planticolens]NOU99514.1 hypothetical protein [Paenibacillus planticolens]